MIHLLVVLLLLFVIYLGQSTRKPERYPPGPRWLPLVGCGKEFKTLARKLGGMHLAAEELSKKYASNVIGLKLGSERVVLVMKYDLVKEVLTRDEFNNRPDNFFMRLRCMGTRRGITGIEGPVWHKHRSFLLKHFKTLGYGDKAMEFMIREELAEILEAIKTDSKAVKIEKIIAPAVLNVLWTLTFGSRRDRTDRHLDKLLKLFDKRIKAFDISGGALAQYPWLRFVAPGKVGYNLIVKLNEEVRAFFMEIIVEHYKTWSEGRNEDFIYGFISEMKAGKDESFNENQLVMICLDIFFGGAATTSNTIDFALLMMILHPDLQRKVQNQIDKAIEKNRDITYSDRSKLPFVEAVLLEVVRMYAVVPVSGPRTVLSDTHLDNFIIPKSTTILFSIYSIHMDRDYWSDPEVFRPERFLGEDGKILHDDRILAFGFGKRRCLGEILAKSCLFIIFTEILRKYSLKLSAGSRQPTGIPVPGITLTTEKYTVEFTER